MRNTAVWSEPMRCDFDVQTCSFPLIACCSCTEQRSHPVKWRCSLVFAGF